MPMLVSGPPWLVSIPGASPNLRQVNFVVSGLDLPASGSLTPAMAGGEAAIDGFRVLLAPTTLNLTASRDNYVDLSYNTSLDAVLIVTPVVIAAAAPALGPRSMRLGFLRTDASTITARTTFAKDSLGNWMGNRSPLPITSLSSPVGQPLPSTGGGITAIGFAGAAIVNIDNQFGHSLGQPTRIVVSQSGIYRLSGYIDLNGGNNGFGYVKFFIDGVDRGGDLGYQSANDAAAHQLDYMTPPVFLAAGSYAELAYDYRGTNTANSNRAWFAVERVGG
jgi:hypothetical protein